MSTPQLLSLRDDIGRADAALTTRARYQHHMRDHISAIIRSRKSPRFKISDHAVIRYLEKVKGQDIDAVRAELQEHVARAANGHGVVCRGKGDAQTFTADGLTFVVTQDYAVATVYRADDEYLATDS